MIFHFKFIFAWILLIPKFTGSVFNRDFDRILCVYFLLWGSSHNVPFLA